MASRPLRGNLAGALLSPEQLEHRIVMAGLAGRDTNDFYMVPKVKAGDPPNPQWNMQKIQADIAWTVYNGSPRSVVVVQDYGLDFRHEDFSGSAVTQGQFWDYGKIFAPDGRNFEFSKKGRDDFHYVVNPPIDITRDPKWNDHTLPDPGQYLGNIGAGIIGASTNNSIGVAAINWDGQLYSSKVVVGGTTSHDIIAKRANRTIQYLRLGKVDGIQDNPNPQLIRAVSFGYSTATDYGDIFHTFEPVPETAPDGAGHYDFVSLGKGIERLTGDAKQGILVTVPTGDYNKTWPTKYYDAGSWGYWKPWTIWNPSYPRGGGYSPGRPDNVIAVAATDINDLPWEGNAKNPIDIYAPGEDIWSLGEQPKAYVKESGTRQAQAHVAGAISLLYDVANQHGFQPTYHQVREAIIEGGDNIGLAKPRLNIVNSIKYLSLFAKKDLTKRPEPTSGSLSITTDDKASNSEGNVGVTQARFALRLDKAIGVPVTINVKIEDGSAMAADGDFVSPNAAGVVRVTIPAGSQVAWFTVDVKGDRKVEPDEFFNATIVSAPGNLKVAENAALARWTIKNDDLPPTVSLVGARAVEGSALRAGVARVFAVLDRPSLSPLTLQYSIVNGTARAGVDFARPATQVISVRAGATSVPIDIRIIGDSMPEPDKGFQVRLDSVDGTPLSVKDTAPSTLAQVTIVDDDRILVTAQQAAQAAVAGSNGTMLFRVTLSRVPSLAEGGVQVAFRTINGIGVSAAIAGTDYQGTSGTLSFSPGERSKTIAVTVLPRQNGQRYPKSFSLELSSVSAAGWLAGGLSSQAVLGRIT